MNPFGRAEKKHAEEERRDHEYLKNNKQKRIKAAAAPDAIEVSAMALTVPAAPAEAEKNVNGDFVLWPKCTVRRVQRSAQTHAFIKIPTLPSRTQGFYIFISGNQ
jgi:hypothetical protein